MLTRSLANHAQILDIYFQRAGFRMGEGFALHSRRRFRLSPAQIQGANIPQVDPNLWIVHYGPSEKSDAMPVNMIPTNPQIQATLNFRQHLFQLGQITRKEFMLSDRVNWPQIPLPGRGQSMYAAPPSARGIPQTMAYPPHGAGAAPKRRGPAPPGSGHQPAVMGVTGAFEAAHDDEEDTSRGDMFDHLTAREISMARYQQNHEWMEEVLSSPYRLDQIVAADLGLGLRGELASLTQGVFEAQGAEAWEKIPAKPYAGRLDPKLADEFRQRIEAKTAVIEAEVAEMKAKHEQIMAKFKGNATIKHAEQEIRHAVHDSGAEIWRLEGRQEVDEDGGVVGGWKPKHNRRVEDIVAHVEAAIGKKIQLVHEVHRVADGGYDEGPGPEQEPEPQSRLEQPLSTEQVAANRSAMSRQPSNAGSHGSGAMMGDSDIDMGGTAAGLLDQMHTGFSSMSTPMNSFPTPQPQLSAIPSAAGTPSNMNAPSPHPAPAAPAATAAPAQPPVPTGAVEDVSMEDARASKGGPTAPGQGTGTSDWVAASKDGHESGSAAAPGGSSTMAANARGASGVTSAPSQQPGLSSKPGSAAATPGSGLGFDADHNDFGSLGDLDTAGDALANYDGSNLDNADGELGDLGMDMEDSAFGDAFHGVGDGGDLSAEGA